MDYNKTKIEKNIDEFPNIYRLSEKILLLPKCTFIKHVYFIFLSIFVTDNDFSYVHIEHPLLILHIAVTDKFSSL